MSRQQVDEAALVQLLGLALGERVDEHGARRACSSSALTAMPALLAQLVERVAAAGGIEQVGGDLGVEDEVGRDVAERLGVVGDDRALAGGGDELGGVVDLARRARARRRRRRRSASAPRAGSARPRRSPARRATSASGSPPSMSTSGGRPSADRDRLGVVAARAAGSPRRRPRLERLLEAAQRVAQLPLAERSRAGPARSGRAGDLGLEVEVDGDVAHDRGELLGERARRRRARSGSPCAWRRRSRRRCASTVSRSPKRCSSSDAVLSPMPGTPGMLSRRVALEADEVGDQLGRDAVAVDDALAVVDLRVRDARARWS